MQPLRASLVALSMLCTSAQPYYWRYPRMDVTDNTIGFIGGEIDQMMAACNVQPQCLGFNSDGFLKGNVNASVRVAAVLSDLYVKAATPQPPRLNVWPKPISVANGSATVAVATSLNFVATTPCADLSAAFARTLAVMFPTSPNAAPTSVPTLTQVTVTVANVSVPLQIGIDESYVLSIPADGSAATLTANTTVGAYRGLETLSQIVRYDFDAGSYVIDMVPLFISDAPAFAYRGLLMDSSRHFQPVRSIQHLLDSMSYAKLNVLHWHIVDYQAWPVQSAAYPLLWSAAWSPRERYTLQDLAAVVEYARQLGIVVVPEFDTPGHADAVCTGYPDACPSPTCTTPLNPASNLTLQLINGVLTEWAGIFPSQLMHLGGDEVDTTCWNNTPAVVQWMSQHGLTPDQTYEYFVMQTDAMATRLGRNPMRWEEVWNHFGTALPPNTVVHVWLDHATLANVTGSGYYAVLSNNDVYYLDNLDEVWDAFYDNDLLAGVPPAAQKYVLGGEVCMWGERVDTSDLLQTVWPRAAAAAERQWSYHVVGNSSDPDLYERITAFRCLLNSRGVPAAPVNNLLARFQPWGPGSCVWQ